MEVHGQLPDMEQLSVSIAAKHPAGRLCQAGSTSSSSTDEDTIPAARMQPEADLELKPLGAAAAKQLSIEQHLELAEFKALERGIPAETAADPPAKDLADVSHRLKKLEKAVKAHLLGGARIAGDSSIRVSAVRGSSILSSAGGQQHKSGSAFDVCSGDDLPNPGVACGSERSCLKETLSGIKTDIADLAVHQVEAQLLQQRVLRLEAAIGGIGGLSGLVWPTAAGLASGFTSFAGSTAVPGKAANGHRASTVRTPRDDAAPRLTRSPSDVSVLVNRLTDMEGVIKELAQAQVANTAVLQQIGGRLPSPVPPSPDNQCYSSAAVGAFAPPRGSPVQYHPRPPSCPLTGGPLNSSFGYSPPEPALPQRRAPSPDTFGCPRSWFANIKTYGSSSHAGSGALTGCSASSAAGQTAVGQPSAYPAIPAVPSMAQHSVQQQRQTDHPFIREQPLPHQAQQQWQVEVVLAGHDADIAQVKEAVQQLEHRQQAADTAIGSTGAQVCSLADRMSALEQSVAAAGKPGEATVGCAQQSAEGDGTVDAATAPAAGQTSGTVSALHQADLVSAIEGLAADAVQAASRLDVLEVSMGKQLANMEGLQESNDHLQGHLHQVSSTVQELSAQVKSLQAASAAPAPPPFHAHDPGPSAPPTHTALEATHNAQAQAPCSLPSELLQQQLLQQLLNSKQLQQLLDTKVQQLLQARVEEAVAIQLDEAAGHAADLAAQAAEAGSAATSPTLGNSRLQALLSEDSASEEVGSLPSAVSCCPTPGVPGKLQDAFDALSERIQKMQSHAAAGQAEVIHEAMQHLHTRLLQVEEVLAKQGKDDQHNRLQTVELPQQQPCIQVQTGISSADEYYSSDSGHLAPTAVIAANNLLQEVSCHAAAAAAAADENDELADSGVPAGEQLLSSAGTDVRGLCADGTVRRPLLGSEGETPAHVATSSSDVNGIAAESSAIVAEASSASTDHLEHQVAALQQEMTSHQVAQLEATVEDMCRQMAAVQQALVQQAALLDQQRASTAASFAVLSPLEPRMHDMAGRLAALSESAALQPGKLEALQQEIEQLSRQLAEVNESAADEAELDDLKALVDSVTGQQRELQLQFEATQALAAAAVQAATAAAADAVTVAAAAQEAREKEGAQVATTAPIAPEQLQALEASVQQQLSSTQDMLARLQLEVERRVAEAEAQAAAATTAASSHSADAEVLSELACALAGKLGALEVDVTEHKAAIHSLLEQKFGSLQTATEEYGLKLYLQVQTMAQTLAAVGQAKAAQAQQLEAVRETQVQAAASQGELQSSLLLQLTATARQLSDELQSALWPLQQQLSDAEQQLAEHEAAISHCAKASVLTGVVATVQDLPSAVEGLTSRLDQLVQTQRAAEGQLHAGQEQYVMLNGQLATLQQHVETLAANAKHQQGQLSGEVERVGSQLLAPVRAELEQLQELKRAFATAQEQQAGVAQQLGAAVDGVREDVMAELGRSRDELAQSIEELQMVITERCLKTDQLGQIFAARDNMYGAWMKMQAVFQSNKSHSGATSSRRPSTGDMLFKRRPSSTLSASTSIICTAVQPSMPFAPVSLTLNAEASGGIQQPTAAAYDPFTELATRLVSSHTSTSPSTSSNQDESEVAAVTPTVTPEAVLAASTRQQPGSMATHTDVAAVVTPADLASVLESQFQLRQTVAQLAEQVTALRQQTHCQWRQDAANKVVTGADFSNNAPSAEGTNSSIAQLHAAVAQLSQQPAAVQPHQIMTTPALQAHSGLTQRSDSSAFLLALQQELAGIAIQVVELHSKVEKQEVQIEAVVHGAPAVLATVTALANPTKNTSADVHPCTQQAASGAATLNDVGADWLEEVQRSLAALAAEVDNLQQQRLDTSLAQNAGTKLEGRSTDAPQPVLPAGVLHAPLSVVVQLQKELAGLKEAQVSKDQFVAVVRMIKEQKDHSTAAAELHRDTFRQIDDTLHQHAEQLSVVESSLASLVSRLEITATVAAVDLLNQQQQLHQQSSAAALEQISNHHAKLECDLAALQTASEQQAAALDSISLSEKAQSCQLASQQHTTDLLTAELAKVAASIEELTAKLAAEREAHLKLASMVNAATSAANLPRRAFSEGQEAPGSAFSELVAGIAKLKDCVDVNSQAVSGLQEQVNAQEAIIAELAAQARHAYAAAEAVVRGLDSVTPPPPAAAATEKEEPVQHRISSNALVHSVNSPQQSDISDSCAASADITQAAAEVQAEAAHLKDTVAALEVQQKQAGGQTCAEQTAAVWSRSVSGSGCAIGATGCVVASGASAVSNSASFSRRVSKISSIAAADAFELTAAAADEAAVAVAGPMALVHQILMELKKRVEALEAANASAAVAAPQPLQVGAATAAVMHCNQLFVPRAAISTPSRSSPVVRRPAPWQAAGDAATMAELQDLVVSLQQDVVRIDMESSSNAANLTSLRGDVGAAAAAAAQAAAAVTAASNHSKRYSSMRDWEPAAATNAVASFDSASIAAQAASASAVAAVAQEAATQAQAAVSAVQDGLCALTQELLHLQTELVKCKASIAASITNAESAPAVDASAVTALQEEISNLKAAVDQMSNDSKAAAHRAAEQQVSTLAKIQTVQEEVQQVKAAADSSTATATAAVSAVGPASENHEQLQLLQKDVAEHRRQLTLCLSAAAAEALVAKAVTELREELQALQDQVAWASSEAAAAACTAASNAVEDAKDQLVEDLQGRVGRAVAHSLQASLASVAPELAAAAIATIDGASEAGLPSGALACEVQAAASVCAAQRTCTSNLSFNDLATAPSPTSRALVQQLFANVASATNEASTAPDKLTAQHVNSASVGVFEPLFTEVPHQQQPSAAAVVDGGFGSLVGDTTATTTAATVALGDMSSEHSLGAHLDLLSTAHQVEFLTKLAGVVSSHAARLLVTYQDHPVLADQLHTVQARLSAAVASTGAASKAVHSSESSSVAEAGGRRFSANSSIRVRSDAAPRPDACGAPGFAAGEVLLGILDQVASLRAIGSATHPAVNQALQKHEAQIAALLEAQQRMHLQEPGSNSIHTAETSADNSAGIINVATYSVTERSISNSNGIVPAATAAAAPPAPAISSAESFEGEYSQRLSALESRLAAGLKMLSDVRSKLSPLREVADATQSMMRELQVAHGLVLQRIEALEGLASAGVGTTVGLEVAQTAGAIMREELAGSALAVAGSLRKMQNDMLGLSRRVSAAEANLAATSECLTFGRRLAARVADADTRGARLAGQVSSVASSLPIVVERVVDLEGRLSRSLGAAKRGLDILADQLVALGALNGRASPNKNLLAALGPNHAAITALEGKVEAVRTAMTASVRLMMSDLAADTATASSTKATPGLGYTELGAGVVSAQLAASEAVNSAVVSHQEALNGLETKIAELRAELHTALAAAGKQGLE